MDQPTIDYLCQQLTECIKSKNYPSAIECVNQLIQNNITINVDLDDYQPTTLMKPAEPEKSKFEQRQPRRWNQDPEAINLKNYLQQN